MKKILATGLLSFIASQGIAAELESTSNSQLPEGLYAGGGLNYNDLDLGSVFSGANNETALGFQIFAGLPIASSIEGFKTFAEVGFFRTTSFDFGAGNKEKVTGVWGSGVLQRDLNEIDPNLYGLARIGLEIGDDDGIFMGVGAGYRINQQVEVRAEFVNKDLLTSYQANALFRF